MPYLDDEQAHALRTGPFREDALPFTWAEAADVPLRTE